MSFHRTITLHYKASVITAFMLALLMVKNVEAAQYPFPFPYIIDGASELKSLISKKQKQLHFYLENIDLKNGLKVIGVFQTTGSGIERINVYLYLCETNKCILFLFLKTQEEKGVSIELFYDTKELGLKSSAGIIFFRTAFPYLYRVDK